MSIVPKDKPCPADDYLYNFTPTWGGLDAAAITLFLAFAIICKDGGTGTAEPPSVV